MSKPWLNEPMRDEWIDPETGLECLVKRVSMAGHWCGYVCIPEDHPLHGVGYSEPVPPSLDEYRQRVLEGPIGKRGILDVFFMDPNDMHCGVLFNVHGGITFSDDWNDGKFWYGFDCGHSGDLSPETADRYPDLVFPGAVYRDIDYVKAECTSLARQIAALQPRKEPL